MKFFSKNNTSTWMLVAALIAVAIMARPNLLSCLLLPIIACWLVFTREVARREGVTHSLCLRCVLIAGGVMAVAFFLMTKISWLAL